MHINGQATRLGDEVDALWAVQLARDDVADCSSRIGDLERHYLDEAYLRWPDDHLAYLIYRLIQRDLIKLDTELARIACGFVCQPFLRSSITITVYGWRVKRLLVCSPCIY